MYHLGLALYWLAACLAAPFKEKAAFFVRGHRGWRKRLRRFFSASPPNTPTVWFHCASLGEFEQGRPLIEAWHRTHPEDKIVLTFFSPSGYEARKNYRGADLVFYLPLDTRWNARTFLNVVRPAKIFFIKYEYWYNFLTLIKKRNIPCYLVSAIFLPEQPFFKWYGFLWRRMLRCFTMLFVQNQDSLQRLAGKGIHHVSVCGDTRFDRVQESIAHDKTPDNLRLFMEARAAQGTLLVAGSTWPQDEQCLLHALAAIPSLQLVMAPHEIHSAHTAYISRLFADFCPVFLSQNPHPGTIPASRVLVADTIGLLSSLYRYGHLAYIGGGFNPSGIHNTLEAATYGKALLFGPEYDKFQEAKDLIALQAAKSYHKADELREMLQYWVDHAGEREAAGAAAGRYVAEHLGATHKILNLVP